VKATDVIVVGAGGAGLIAAIAAADEGAKVLHLEKMPRTGGCWAYLGGTTTGAQTKIQFEAGINNDSPYLFYADCMKAERTRLRCDPEILMFYCQHTGPAVDWLDSLGAFAPQMRQPMSGIYGENWTVPRCNGVMEPLLNIISPEYEKRVNRGDIELLTNTGVTDLLQVEGRIVGVRAKGGAGGEREYRAGAVIVCTGGFGNNMALVRQRGLLNAREIISGAPAFAKGDGLIMCERVEAKLVNMGQPPPMGPHPGGVPNPANPVRQIASANMNKYPGVIWVDMNGRRVVNEDCGSMGPEIREAALRAPEHILIVILDQKIRNENDSILTPWLKITPARSWEWFEEKAEEGAVIKKANTIEELGRSLGVNVQNLKDTIDKWNGYVAAGEDLEFGRKDLGYKIENPPFYAIKTIGRIVGTGGGPATNVRQQVLSSNDKMIPGLYVAGEVAGFQGYGTGMYNMGNIVFGQQAGRMAARDVLHRQL